ncbi:hypothetical protein MLD38_036349 [Melastoma candidum]|uniref:Uncharacterized protein n=1 Tax=Melastoma candidum TaxID=119954 RepID=A0ACB9LIY2_9MYRT|nr:hypothetical protein MLD38_036349 [Melastoma candidum]
MGCALDKKMFLRMSVDPAIRKMDLKIEHLERRLQGLKVVKEKLDEARKEHEKLITKQKFRDSLLPKISY